MNRPAFAAAAVAALVIGVAALAALGQRFGINPDPTPSDGQTVELGIFEPIAGWIVYGNERGIWGVDPAAAAIPARRVQLTSGAGNPLGWSSDGTRLLIMRDELLFVLHSDGSETQVTERPMAIRGAAISPDGSRVVFATIDGAGDTGFVFAVDAGGGPAEVLLELDGLEGVSFSPDGTQIAYLSGRGDSGHRVSVMDADGTNPREILANDVTLAAGHDHGIAWSPAGDRIALGIEGTIYTFAPDGSGFTVALVSGRFEPFWSPDGSQLDTRGPWHPAGRTQRDEEALQPAVAELVLQFQSWWTGGEGPARTAVAVYADGGVIWDADGEGDYLELRLTSEGIERLRSRAVSTGLFEHDLALGLDLDIGSLEVFRGDQSVNVAWGRTRADLFWTDLQDRFVEATPAQAGELTDLVAFFSDPAAWALPPEMYRHSEITPFVPTNLVVGFDRAAPDWSTLPSPAREVVTRHLEPALRDQCDISIDQAREVVDALVQADVIAAVDDVRLGFSFDLGRSFVHLHQALPPVADCP